MGLAKRKHNASVSPEEHLQNLFALSLDMLCVAGFDGYLKSVNPAFTKILGFSTEEFLQTPYANFVHPDDRKIAVSEMQKLRSGIPTISFECRFLTKDKEYRWLSWRCTPVHGLLYGVARDLTDKKLSEDLYAQQKEKMVLNSKVAALGEMAGGIAHEVNNPLAIILGRSGLLLSLLKNDEVVLDRLKLTSIALSIDQTALRISKIIQGLRHISRTGAPENLEIAKMENIISDTLSFCAQRFKAKRVQLQVPVIDNELSLLCHPIQISQVVLNLLNNAYYAVKDLEQKWIRIEVLDKGSNIEIAIADSGNGIPEEFQEKIFEPFFTTKPIGSGTGLGLSVSKGIVESHNGKIELDRLSKNTRIVVSLPKSQKQSLGGKHAEKT